MIARSCGTSKIYASHGYKDFVLCLGYKGEMIKEYFRNYLWNTCDATLPLGRQANVHFHGHHDEEDWSITLADTGQESMTAWRIKSVARYLDGNGRFLLTYGDGVGDAPIRKVVAAWAAVLAAANASHPERFV